MKKVAIFNDTSISGHFGCIAVTSNLNDLLLDHNMEPVYFWPVGANWIPHSEKIKEELRNVDAVILNGEGTLHNDSSREQVSSLLQLPRFCNEKLKKPCFLVNATLHNMSKGAYLKLRDFQMIFVRDRCSQKFLRSINIESFLCPDLSFLGLNNVRYVNLSGKEEKNLQKNILVTGSVLNSINHGLLNFAKKNGYQFEDMKPANSELNRWGARQMWLVYEDLRNFYPSFYHAHNFWLNHLANQSFIFTGRFHCVTMCLGLKKPFFAFESNTPKISNLLNDIFDKTNRVLRHKDIEGFFSRNYKADLDFAFSSKELQKIEDYLKNGEIKCHNMATQIANSLNK